MVQASKAQDSGPAESRLYPDTEYADGTGLGGGVWVREAKVCVIS